MKVVKIESTDSRDLIITLEWRTFWLRRRRTGRVRGECTVWNWYPSGRRCGTLLDGWLYEVWQKYVWEQEEKNKQNTETVKKDYQLALGILRLGGVELTGEQLQQLADALGEEDRQT